MEKKTSQRAGTYQWEYETGVILISAIALNYQHYIKAQHISSQQCIWYFVCIFFTCRIILDSDATSIVQKVSLRTDDLNIGEQTMAQVS